ncbi:MAG: DUF805 domain-containing protein [Candidatus Liptonbacteria bacterium]|nr:DUF805 domain-containing protein [Candidatus Liptonbacteria bacterium]
MQKLANLFRGRINRRTYLLGLISLIPSLVMITIVLRILMGDLFWENLVSYDSGFIPLGIIIFLPIYYVSLLSLLVRRLHDIGHSGWLALAFLGPVLAPNLLTIFILILLALFFVPGEERANKYGERPIKGIKFFDAVFNRDNERFLASSLNPVSLAKASMIHHQETKQNQIDKNVKGKITNWIKNNWLKLLLLILFIAVIGGSFYWYELRPSQAKKECYRKIYTNALNLSGFGQEIVNGQLRENEIRYKNCLKEEGF